MGTSVGLVQQHDFKTWRPHHFTNKSNQE